MTRRPRRIEPGPGQESVWDYPRPPRLERTDSVVRVEHAGAVVGETTRAYRVLETSQPPGFYLPPDDVALELLRPTARRTLCEWKGSASYLDVVVGHAVAPDAAWTYPTPAAPFAAIRDHVAFYPQRVDACFVDGERVEPNDGTFYGGWITSAVVGPFKGSPGTSTW
ncbi:MAG TPA: DUF427 domain-containing protein [Acidimicrobiales bacterium]|nr:DUF427 domain-containing protein [Acidimicrobiales bacterium]